MATSADRHPSDRQPVAGSRGHVVLVVVPTLNEATHIEDVLRQLGADTRQHGLLFVVADGGSSDGTQDIVGRLMRHMPQLRLLHNPKRLQSAAMNLAVRTYGQGAEMLVRCDAHAGYPPGYVQQLQAALQRTGADAVVVPMDSVGHGCLGRAVAWTSDSLMGSGGSAHRGGRSSGWVDHGHHAAFRIDSFIRAGGYDEGFSHNEDAELDCRQRALGGRIYLDADIRVHYFPRETFAGLWRQYRTYGGGRARTVARHPGSLRLRQFLVPAHLLACVAALPLALLHLGFLVWPVFYLAALLVLALGLVVRHRSACALLSAPAALVMHSAWALGFLHGMLRGSDGRWLADRARALTLDTRDAAN